MPVEAPPAPPAPVQTAPKPAPAAPPPPSTGAQVKAKSFEALRELGKKGPNLANVDPEVVKQFGLDKPQPDKPAEPVKPTDQKPPDKPVEQVKATDKPADKPEEPDVPDPRATDKKAKPWKLVQTLEKKNRELLEQITDARSKITDPDKMSSLTKRAEAAETRLKELEDHIRYVDYSKSTEFKDTYEKPYQEYWGKAAAEMRELTVTDAEGNSRTATVDDLYALANMPLGEARKRANEMFGDAADDVMAHRRRVRELSDAQTKALDDAKKNGAERQTQQTESLKRATEESVELFKQFINEDTAKYDFLKPKDGDDEWNSNLDKAVKFVDGAYGQSPSDPKLSKEQRAEIIKRHTAIRNRAIGFSPLKLEIKRLKAENESLNKIVADYKAGEPGAGAGKPSEKTVIAPQDLMAASKAELRKRMRDVNLPTP